MECGIDGSEEGGAVPEDGEEVEEAVDLGGGVLEEFAVLEGEELGVGAVGEKGVGGGDLVLPSTGEEGGVGGLGLAGAGEHGGLGSKDLGKGPLDEDDFEREAGGDVGEERADDFDGLAVMGGEPCGVTHQRFHRRVFEVAVGVVRIRRAEGIGEDGVATGMEEAHDERGAGAGKAGDDDEGSGGFRWGHWRWDKRGFNR